MIDFYIYGAITQQKGLSILFYGRCCQITVNVIPSKLGYQSSNSERGCLHSS